MNKSYEEPPPPYSVSEGMDRGAPQRYVVNTLPLAAVYGLRPQPLVCPHCRIPITTRVENEPGTKTHLFALLLCLLGCIPCCIIPYCIDSCNNSNHYCTHCGSFLGSCNTDNLLAANRNIW